MCEMKTEIYAAERKVAEQSLQESEQRYNRLLASTADYVYTVTVDQGRSVATSHGAGCKAVTGFTSREFEADPFLWSRMIYEEDRPAVLAQVAHILKGEVPIQVCRNAWARSLEGNAPLCRENYELWK
jgi:PAS domain-containing protein